MKTNRASENVRPFGIAWVILAPLIVLAAAISKIESDATYYAQFAIFSLLGSVALICGVAAIMRLTWGYFGVMALSWLATLYFFGAAVAGMVMVTIHQGTFTVTTLGIGALMGITGVPFLLMAMHLTKLRNLGNDA